MLGSGMNAVGMMGLAVLVVERFPNNKNYQIMCFEVCVIDIKWHCPYI
jgi:hypothetical protein